MIDRQQERDLGCEARRRPAGIAAFVAGFVVTLAFFAFFPGLPHVIDWGAIVVAALVGALTRWAFLAWAGKRSRDSE